MKRLSQATALFVCLMLVITLCCGCANRYDYPGGLNTYHIKIMVDTQTYTAQCVQSVEYTNQTDQTLKELYFNVYANAYESPETAPYERFQWQNAYPNGFNEGNITFAAVRIDGEDTAYRISGAGNTLMRIDIGELAPGEKTLVEMAYALKMPNSPGRYGYGQLGMNFGNCFPILCVYDGENWVKEPYHRIGDPFYSEAADYRVHVTLDSAWRLASSGYVEQAGGSEQSEYLINAPAVRDFAMVASPSLQHFSRDVQGTTVESFAVQESQGRLALDYAQKALKTFNALFGGYPYESLSVAESNFFIGGMEYPNMVMVDTRLYDAGKEMELEYVVVHEVAHQWWYGVVGNDQVNEPWLDEALSEYATLLYYKQNYGEEKMKEICALFIEQDLQLARDYLVVEERDGIGGRLDSFESNFSYNALVYSKGALMFRELHEKYGDDLIRGLKIYYEQNRFKNASAQQLFDALQQGVGVDCKPEIQEWLSGRSVDKGEQPKEQGSPVPSQDTATPPETTDVPEPAGGGTDQGVIHPQQDAA
ncbi:MAG: M1 family metallopeptidase [Christensenellales bacterium]|jgi:hypothetical protein